MFSNLLKREVSNASNLNTQLNFEADTIEEVLASFGHTDVFVSKITSTSVANAFELKITPATKVRDIVNLEDEMAYALGKNSIRITRIGGRLVVEVPKASKVKNTLLNLIASSGKLPPHCAILGVDFEGNPLAIRLSSSDVAHILVAGQTGSGKTALTRSILCSLAYYNTPRQMQFVLIDPKGSGFGPLVRLPNAVGEVIRTPEGAVDKLNQLVDEMVYRDANRDPNRAKILVAIDELADLIMVAGDSVKLPITRLCQRGRECGIHVLACVQKPTAYILGGAMIGNFPIRLVGTVASKNEAKIATGIANSGAEKLEGRGDFLMIKSGSPERFQATWLDAKDFDTIVTATTTGRLLPKGGK